MTSRVLVQRIQRKPTWTSALLELRKSWFKGHRHDFSNVVQQNTPFRLAVIGSGPAGFYSAYRVMTRIEDAVIDMYEQLPVPFGLVRFGVAPDHPEVKNCEEKFSEVAESPRFNFIGNTTIGKDISLTELRPLYHAVLFAYGASKDRTLNIPGEDLGGVYSARDFVGWYNGLPEHAGLAPNLTSGDTAVVIGQGNVALDVARVLLSGVDRLRTTDITEEALETLSRSTVKRVHVVGRRGAMQASFTIKEVRELMQLPDVKFQPLPENLLPGKDNKLARAPKRIAQLLEKYSNPDLRMQGSKEWSLDFMLSPQEFYGSQSASSLSSIQFRRNRYEASCEPFEAQSRVVPTDHMHNIDAALAFRSIGYKSEPLPGMEKLGIEFDQSAGIIRNVAGRVVSGDRHIPGTYCAGWVKRGPTGVIASTMEDAFSTAELIALDWNSRISSKPGVQAIESKLSRPVDWTAWKKIDKAERARGESKGKNREKFRTTEEMLNVL